jgi:Phage P2 GpE.
MEQVAFVYGWTLRDLDLLTLDDLEAWAAMAAQRLKVGPFLIR